MSYKISRSQTTFLKETYIKIRLKQEQGKVSKGRSPWTL